MNRFLQRGRLQTIEPQKDTSVVEDMDTLVSEVIFGYGATRGNP